MSAAARVLRAAIRLYQRAFAWRPSPCRFHPSCSAYAIEALEVHGALRGAGLALRRIVRCQPWGGFGMDPVPPRSGATAVTPRAADDTGMRIHV